MFMVYVFKEVGMETVAQNYNKQISLQAGLCSILERPIVTDPMASSRVMGRTRHRTRTLGPVKDMTLNGRAVS